MTVLAPTSSSRGVSARSTVLLSTMPLPFGLPDAVERPVLETLHVIGYPYEEQEQNQHEAHDAGALHRTEGDRPAAHLLRERPEDVPSVEGQERREVDDGERERDQAEDRDGLRGVVLERPPRALVAADDAADLVALLGAVDDAGDAVDGELRDLPHGGDAAARGLPRPELLRVGLEGE